MAGQGMTLEEFLLNEPVGEFKPEPLYERYTDSLIFYAVDCRSYAKRINPLVTVFLSDDDDSLIGIEIKGVSGILERTSGIIAMASDGQRIIALSVLVECALAPEPEVDDSEVIKIKEASKNWGQLDLQKLCA